MNRYDGMSEAIAMSSPSGRMSKRARKAAEERLRVMLFGPNGLQRPECPQPDRAEKLRRHASRLLELAERGMCTMKYRREAAAALAEADALDNHNATQEPTL